MGLFDAITGSVVMKYKVETDQAKAKIKELSGEQKKAAKEAAEALEKQGKAAESMASQYAKGAAIIAGAYVLARDGVKQMREESRLSAGAAGVDIDALSDSWDGLKTRMDLLTLAQAGHRGAWKLTTAQIQQVSEGMRALEKQGYDSGEVFDKFTAIMKKGKLEGLDDFGLSLKSTGDQTKDLQILMNALRGEVRQVGGDFTMAGDDVVRATVKMEDGINRVRRTVGMLTTEIIQAASDFGENLGRFVGGNENDPQSWQFNAGDQYAYNFARRRAGLPLVPNGSVSAAAAFAAGGAQDADFAAAAALGKFRAQVRRARSGNGPLASMAPSDFADQLSSLPQGWRDVDPVLGAMADNLRDQLEVRMQTVGVDTAKSLWNGFKAEFAKNAAELKNQRRTSGRRGGGRGGAAAPEDDWLSGALSGAIGTASAFGSYLGDVGAANQNRAREDEIAQQRWAATMEQNRRWAVDMAALNDQLAKDKEESFLTKVFGPIEDFDTYTFALTSIGDLTKNVWGGIITTIANGEELSGKAIRKMIAQTLGAKASELGADGLIAVLRGTWKTVTGNPTGPAEVGAGLAMMAGAVTIAGIARGIGGSATVPSASGGGARGGRNQDHRGSGGGEWRPAGQQTVIVLGSDYGDNSQRVRERNAYAAFSRTATVYQPPRGAAA